MRKLPYYLLLTTYYFFMDIFSHGLYGGLAFGRQAKKYYWLSFFFGVLPDLFSFGIFTVLVWLGLSQGVDWGSNLPPESSIPAYVHILYNVTHSLITAAVVIGLVALISQKLPRYLLAWPLHICVDIFTHSRAFFATPFLWPLSNYRFDGANWGSPMVFIPNVILLIILYATWWLRRRSCKSQAVSSK